MKYLFTYTTYLVNDYLRILVMVELGLITLHTDSKTLGTGDLAQFKYYMKRVIFCDYYYYY